MIAEVDAELLERHGETRPSAWSLETDRRPLPSALDLADRKAVLPDSVGGGAHPSSQTGWAWQTLYDAWQAATAPSRKKATPLTRRSGAAEYPPSSMSAPLAGRLRYSEHELHYARMTDYPVQRWDDLSHERTTEGKGGMKLYPTDGFLNL
jgi:hypothetical protein